MVISAGDFVARVAASGLMTTGEVAEFLASLPPPLRTADAGKLAREFVREKKLTAYQAQQIYKGQGKSLVLGNYVVLDTLGQGGMGIVLKAEHRRMQRIVALKVLSPSVVKSPELRERFQREVRAAARLNHPHIVAAFDADEAGGTHYLVMEYVEGLDLAAVVKERGPLAVDKAVECIIQTARGLQYAHDQGVIHRDIKPSNLLLDQSGTVKILDMGLARIESAEGQADLTTTGAVMGTVDFMAPEQALSTRNAEARSDQYSLGISLWYLLTGRPAYPGDSLMARLLAHRDNPIPSLRQARSDVPAALDAVFRKMVAKKPDDRYPSLNAAILDLQRCLDPHSAPLPVYQQASESRKLSEFLGSLAQESGVGTPTRKTIPSKSSSGDLPVATILASDASIQTDPVTLARVPSVVSANSWWQIARDRRVQAGLGIVGLCLSVFPFFFFRGGPENPQHAPASADAKPPAVSSPAAESKYVSQIQQFFGSGPVDAMDNPAPGTSGANAPAPPPQGISQPAGDFTLEFNGLSRVVIPNLFHDGTHPLTIEATVWADSPRAGPMDPQLGRLVSLISNRDPSGCSLALTSLRGYQAMLGSIGPAGRDIFTISGQTAPPQGTARVMLAAIFQDREVRLFVNGRARASGTLPQAATPSQLPFVIGADPEESAANSQQNFVGRIDEIRFSRGIRYATDYNPAARLVADGQTLALYHCDEGSGSVLRDDSGNGHDGQILGARWVSADDPGTSALSGDGWTVLFDGRDTSQFADLGKFRVEDGLLVASERTLACSNGEYTDFDLEFEWRVAKGGNGGVLYRVRKPASATSAVGYEYQVIDDAGHPNGRSPLTATASLYGVLAAANASPRPVGEFNESRILLQKGKLQYWLNGSRVLEADFNSKDFKRRVENLNDAALRQMLEASPEKGMICLQGHTNQVAYRNVRIRDLSR